MTVRIGLVGAGAMGTAHARSVTEHVPGARISQVFDRDRERASAVAAFSGATIATSAEKVIADEDVDAVIVASPDATHPELALACIEEGKPALCEKPLAMTSAEAWRVVEREAAAGRRFLQIGFMRKYDPGFTELKQVVSSGVLGEPQIVHSVHRNPSSLTSATDAGIVTGSMIHELDTVPWLLDSRIRAIRVESPRAEGLRDPQLAWLYLDSGAMATVEVFVNAGYGYDIRCEVVGSAGVADLPARAEVATRTHGRHARPIRDNFVTHFADAYRQQLASWVRQLGGGEVIGPSAWDGFLATLVAETGVDSLATGRCRDVPTADQPALYRAGRDVARSPR